MVNRLRMGSSALAFDQCSATSNVLLITRLRPVTGDGEIGAHLATASHMDRASTRIAEILFPRLGRHAAAARVTLAELVFATQGRARGRRAQ
jgi:hypothetical protein